MVSISNVESSGEASATGLRSPETAVSMFRYVTAVFASQGANSSTHSVEPMMPYSSASQEARTLLQDSSAQPANSKSQEWRDSHVPLGLPAFLD